MRVGILIKLAEVLRISQDELLETFSCDNLSETLNPTDVENLDQDLLRQLEDLQNEYRRLSSSLKQQREILQQEFESLHDRVVYLDTWSINVVHETRDIHPGPITLQNQIRHFMEYIC